jgi:hypothetical protein
MDIQNNWIGKKGRQKLCRVDNTNSRLKYGYTKQMGRQNWSTKVWVDQKGVDQIRGAWNVSSKATVGRSQLGE